MKKMEMLEASKSLTEWYESKDYIFDIEEFRKYLSSIKNYKKRLVTIMLSRFIVFGKKTTFDFFIVASFYDVFKIKDFYKSTQRKLKNKQNIFITYTTNEDKIKTIKLY